jgi:hypothetical protein
MTRSNAAIAATATLRFAVFLLASAAAGTTSAAAVSQPFADQVYENGYLYTVDPKDSVRSALAVRGGVIAFVGEDAGARRWIGPRTEVEDLHGRMLMPGLVDGHMHPMAGGYSLLGCDLKYERLTVEQVLERIQR